MRQQRPDDPAARQLVELAWNSPDLLMMLDFEGTILAVNPAWTVTLDRDADSLVGQLFLDFVHAEDVERARERWGDLHDGEPVVDERNRWQDSDGVWRWLSWSLNRDVDVGRVYAAGRDVTGRMTQFLRVTHDRQLLETAERLASVGSWEWNVAADLITLSTGMRQLLRLDGEDGPVRARRLLAHVHPDDRATVSGQIEHARSGGGPVEFEFRVPDRDGHDRILLARVEQHRADRHIVHLYGAAQDVTDQRHLNRLKDAFLAAVSHELRTPLTVAHGIATTLQRKSESLNEAQRRRLQDALERSVVRLSELMTDLLDLARLGRGQMPHRPVRFDLVELTTEVTSAAADAARIVVEGPPQLLVVADRGIVERILANLLENASKYAPTGTVTVGIARRHRDGFRLTVADEGPGVPAQELERIFQPFHRLADDHPQPGAGVGLALVAEFVHAHEGRVCARARDGGAELIVDIPGTSH